MGKFSAAGGKLALRELEALAGARLTGLLAFLFARIARDVSGFFQGGAELGIEFLEGPGDAMRHGAGLAADSAAAHVDSDVELLAHFDGEEGRVGLLGKILVTEVVFELAAVGDQLAGAFNEANA